jgi:hypothetical protein
MLFQPSQLRPCHPALIDHCFDEALIVSCVPYQSGESDTVVSGAYASSLS